jgi:hypothetical protein
VAASARRSPATASRCPRALEKIVDFFPTFLKNVCNISQDVGKIVDETNIF